MKSKQGAAKKKKNLYSMRVGTEIPVKTSQVSVFPLSMAHVPILPSWEIELRVSAHGTFACVGELLSKAVLISRSHAVKQQTGGE